MTNYTDLHEPLPVPQPPIFGRSLTLSVDLDLDLGPVSSLENLPMIDTDLSPDEVQNTCTLPTILYLPFHGDFDEQPDDPGDYPIELLYDELLERGYDAMLGIAEDDR